MEFNGTIIITDPCYFLKDEDKTKDLGDLGFTDYICRDTIYGDWGCKVYGREGCMSWDLEETLAELFEERNWAGIQQFVNSSDGEIGEFCADAGMVAVVLKEDLEKYNPEALEKLKPHMATIIEDYSGDVEDCEFLDRYVVIVGDGFFTMQES